MFGGISVFGVGAVLRLERVCVVNGQMTKASNKQVPLPPLPVP